MIDTLIVVNPDGKIRTINPVTVELLGYKEEELIGRPASTLFAEEQDTPFEGVRMKKLIEEGSIQNYDMTYKTKSGKKIPVSFSYSLMKGEDGNIICIVCTAKDITEHKQAEDELARKQKNLEAIFDAAPVGMLLVDENTVVKRTNDVITKLIGRSSSAIVGCQPGDGLGCIHTSDNSKGCGHGPLCSACPIRNTVEDVLRSGQAIHRVEVQPTFLVGGKEVSPWLELSAEPVVVDGSKHVIITIDDITERKQAEVKLKQTAEEWITTFNSITDMVSIHDKDFKIVRVNKSFANAFNMKQEEIIGKTCYELIHGTKEPPPFCPHKWTLDTGKPNRKEFFEPHLGIYIEASTSLLFDENGQVMGSVHIAKDITERKTAEQRITLLNRLNEDLLRPYTLDNKLKRITDGVVEIFDADFCRVWIIKPGDLCDSVCIHAKVKQGPHVCRYRDRCLHLIVSSGRYTHIDSETHRRVPFGCYEIGRVAAGDDSKFLTNDVTHDLRVHNHDWARKLGLVSFAGYQILSDAAMPMGVFALFSKHVISPEEDALIETLVSTTTQIIQTAEAQAELKAAQEKLIETAHRAGMAEVAADVLHNVGNILNSINVSTTVIREKVTNSELANLEKVASIINEHTDDLGTFLTEHPQGKHIPVYLTEVSKYLQDEQTDIISKLQVMAENVQHIKDIVSMQQSYAKVSGVKIQTSLSKLVEDAIQINSTGLERHGTRLIREFEDLGDVEIDKQRVLQILVNLISNAKYALVGSNREEKLLTIRIYKHGEERLRIEVADNGVGISEDNLTRIFSHGFTTKEHGHGFGLHSCALASKEMGGSLTVHSDGVGQGATFTLELPFKSVEVMK